MTAPRRDRELIPVTILSGQALSAEVNVGGLQIVGILMPAGWDTAGISLQALIRETGGATKTPVWGNVQDQGGVAFLVTAPVLDSYVAIAPTVALLGLGRVRVRSGTSGTPVNQTADRVLYLACLT